MAGKNGKKKNIKITDDDFIKFLLFRLLCCERKENFRNFVLMDRKGTQQFGDFVFVFDTDKDKTKYILIKLINQRVGRNYSCIQDVINAFNLPHYIDRYLSTDEYLKSAKLEELIIFTNAQIIDYFVYLKEKKCKNMLSKRLFGRNVNLYKLNLDNTERICDIFYDQFLSQRKRLANELAMYVMLGKPIAIHSVIKNDSFSLIKTFYLILLEHVIDEENNQFKESFLSLSETEAIKDSLQFKKLEEMEMIKKFRDDFFDSVVEFCQMYEKKDVEELKHIFNFGTSQEEIERATELQQNFVSFPHDKNNYKEITEFLRSKKNLLIEIPEEDVIHLVAKELALSVMLQKTFDISSIVPGQKMLAKFKKIMKENVIEYESKKLKETFLNNNSNDCEIIINFRKCFYNDLKKLHHLLKNKDIKELYGIIFNYCSPIQIDYRSAVYLHETLKMFKIEDKGFADFLLSREIRLENFDKNISSSFFPSEEVDNAAVYKKVLSFLNLIKFAVIKDDTHFLISREIKKIVCYKENATSISDGFIEFAKKWQQEISTDFQEFDSNFENRNFITKQNLVENTCIIFKNKFVKFSDIWSECEFIPLSSLFTIFNNDKMPTLGTDIIRQHGSIYISRTLTQRNKVDTSIFYTFSQDIVILTVGSNFSVTDFNNKHSLFIKFENLEFFNTWDSYFYTTENFSYNFLEGFYNKNKEIVGDRSIHWITYLGSDLRYESSYINESFIITLDECKENKYITEDEIIEKDLRFVIIAGDPGSGKTIVLNHVLHSLKKLSKPPSFYWFIMIPLKECQKYLEKYSNLGIITNAIWFLSECGDGTFKFPIDKLSDFLYESRLVIFFDGFEDLNSKNQEKIKDLFNFLISSNVKQLWVSTSPTYVEELEIIFDVFSFKIKSLNEAEQIYIPRTLSQSNKVDSSIFSTFVEDIIILSVEKKFSVTDFNCKHSVDIILENLKFFNTWNSYFYTTNKFSYIFLEEFYNKKKEIVGNRNIHWFTYLGSDLRYESSYINESVIAMDEYKEKNYLTEAEIIKREKRFVIITGDSGSGKTVFLDHVLHSLEKMTKSAFYWFIMITPKECQKYLEKYSNLGAPENAIKFLSECEKSAGEFSRNILSNFLNHSRLVIFFDGFEDLNSKNQRKMKDLFKFLISSNVKQLWVSTSPPYVEELENTLGVVSFKIEGLCEEQQINLVTNLWKVSHVDSSVIDFHRKSQQLIESFANRFKNQRNLLAVPLYTRTLAVTFKNKIYGETSYNFEGINIFRLCKKYLNEDKNKFLYRKIDKKIKLLNVNRIKTKKRLKKVDRNYHMKPFKFTLEWTPIKLLKEKIRLEKKFRKLENNWKFLKKRKIQIEKETQSMLRNKDTCKGKPFRNDAEKMKLLHARRMETKAYLRKLSTSINRNSTIGLRKPRRIKKYENKIKVTMDTSKCVGVRRVNIKHDTSVGVRRVSVMHDLPKFNIRLPFLKKKYTLNSEAAICQKRKKNSFGKDRNKYVSKMQNMNGESSQIIKRQKKKNKKLVYILKIENKSIMNW